MDWLLPVRQKCRSRHQLCLKSNDHIVSKNLKIKTWDSGKDYGQIINR